MRLKIGNKTKVGSELFVKHFKKQEHTEWRQGMKAENTQGYFKGFNYESSQIAKQWIKYLIK